MRGTDWKYHATIMKNILHFIKRVLVFVLAFAVVVVFALRVSGLICRKGRLGTSHKKHALLAATPSPKVVLVGGSNLHYGINSRMLQDSLGLPVVNMGLQHSLGLRYLFDEVRESLHSGDVLMLLLEPYAYIGMPVEGRTNIARIASIRPKNIRHFNLQHWYNAAMYSGTALIQNYRDGQVTITKKLRGKKTFGENCDEFGDYHGHKGLLSKYKRSEKRDLSDEKLFNNDILSIIQEIQTFIQQNDIQLVISFSPSAESMSDSLVFSRIQAELPAEIVVGNMADYIFPDSFFYDSPDHLIYSKRDMRTRMLLRDLRPIMLKW